MSFNLEEARKAGYSDAEITGFLSKRNPNFDVASAQKAGYSPEEIQGFLAQPNQATQKSETPTFNVPGEPLSDTLTRGISQVPQGLAEGTPPGLIASGFELLGTGKALSDLADLEERLPQMRKLFPHLNLPEKINREEYLKANPVASGYVPTVTNIANYIEEKTGAPLTPKTKVDKALRFIFSLGAFGAGGVGKKLMTGLKGESAKQALELAGIPETVSDALAIAYALHTPTPTGPKLPPEQQAAAQPSGAPPLPPAAPPGGGNPPSGPPGDTISQLLKSRPDETLFETAERAIQTVRQHPQLNTPFGTSAINLPPGGPPPPLAGRVSAAPTAIEKPANIPEIKIEKIETAPARELKGRVEEAPKLGQAITKERFTSAAEGGREESNLIKNIASKERKPVTEAYKEAEAVTEAHADIYPEAAAANDKIIAKLEETQKRNSAEELVYQHAVAVRELIGTTDALIEQQASRLMAQADSTSKMANWELPYTGYKGRVKEIVKNLNGAVINSLQRAGKDAEAVLHADRLFSRWADRFAGDEISPYLEHKIIHPEAIYQKSISDPATYRAVKKALGARKSALMNKIDRQVVEDAMSKFYNDPSKVNSKEYIDSLNNLAQLIGKEKTAEVDSLLRKRKLPQPTPTEKKALPIRPERITGTTREVTPSKKVPLPRPQQPSAKIRPERISGATIDKAAAIAEKSPSEVVKKLNTPEGIRELKKALPKNLYDELTHQKLRSVLREGNIEKEVTSKEIYDFLNKEDTYQLFAEIIGKEETEALRDIAKIAAKNEANKAFTVDTIKKIAKEGAKFALKGTLAIKALKIIFSILV